MDSEKVDDVLDRVDLEDRLGAMPELLREISELFLAEYGQLMEQLENAVVLKDAAAISSAAHALKGAVGNFSARPAREAAKRLELTARSGDLSCLGPLWNELRTEIARLIPIIKLFKENGHTWSSKAAERIRAGSRE